MPIHSVRAPIWAHLFYAAASMLMIAAAPWNLSPVTHTLVRAAPLFTLSVLALAPYVRGGDRRGARLLIGAGLVASMIGDITLPYFFITGIAAFLAAHVLYIAAMGIPRRNPGRQALALVPGAALWLAMFNVVTPRVPAELFVPVVVYLTVITLMLTRALGRVLAAPAAAHVWMLVGAALFVASDSLLAINRWVTPVPAAHVWVLTTYLVAQWCILTAAASSDFRFPSGNGGAL